MFASDVFSDIKALLGNCDDATVFRQITDAVELLSNQTWQGADGAPQAWDSLQSYLTVQVQAGNIVVLPGDVETPIRINVNDRPAMMRDRLFEFMPSGPGSAPGDRMVTSWQDAGTSCTQVYMDGVIPVQFQATGANAIFLTGYDANNFRYENLAVPTTGFTVPLARLEAVRVNVGPGGVILNGQPTGGTLARYAIYGQKDVEPSYRVIRLSSSGATARILYRRKTFAVTALTDYIPLNSRLAVLYMAKAIRRGLTEDFGDLEQQHFARAVNLLQSEQTSRRLAESLAQIDRALGRNPNAGELVMALDLYDDAVDIYGPVGQDRIFEWMTEAVRVLGRKGNWDSLLTYVTTPIVGTMISLPPEVDSYLAISVDGSPARFMGKLWEFSLNGPGENEVYTEATYEDRLDSPTFVVPTGTFRLSKNASSTRIINVAGEDANGVFISNYIPTADPAASPIFSKVTAVAVTKGVNSADYVQLLANGQQIANYAPTDTTPVYRRLKLRKGGQTARILARRKAIKIGGLYDIIPLRSRQSVVLMMKALKAQMDGNPEAATSYETMAVQYLSEEQLVRSSAEGIASGAQVDRSLNLNTRARGVLTVFDIYDECAEIAGQQGRQAVFDLIEQAVDLLQNAADPLWDSQLGYADLCSGDGFTFTLPAEVGDILAVNICGQPARPRNRWIEYHLNGSGQFGACHYQPGCLAA